VKISLAYMEGYEWLSRMLGPVVGVQGVGTPTVPPHPLGSLPNMRGAGISLGGNAERSSSVGLPPVIIPATGVPITSVGTGIGAMVPASTGYSSSAPPPPGDVDELE